MDHGECVAGNPRIYGQLVTTLGKYSKFAGAGDKAAVRKALKDTSGAQEEPEESAEDAAAPAPAPAEKPTLKAKRIKAGDHPANKAPDAPF